MSALRAVLLALGALGLAAPAIADAAPCYTTSVTDAHHEVVTIPDATGELGGDVYVANDLCQPTVGDGSCAFSVWFYQENNGHPGLQRGDEVVNDVANCTDGTIADYFDF